MLKSSTKTVIIVADNLLAIQDVFLFSSKQRPLTTCLENWIVVKTQTFIQDVHFNTECCGV